MTTVEQFYYLHLELFVRRHIYTALGSIMDMKKGMHARTSRNRSHFPSSRSINLPFIKFRLSRVTFNFPLRGPVTSVPWSQWERKRFRLEAHRARRLKSRNDFFHDFFPMSHSPVLLGARTRRGKRGRRMFVIVHTTTTWHGATNCQKKTENKKSDRIRRNWWKAYERECHWLDTCDCYVLKSLFLFAFVAQRNDVNFDFVRLI